MLDSTKVAIEFAEKVLGLKAERVEIRIPKTYLRRDLFGFLDVLAYGRNAHSLHFEVVGFQATVSDRLADHRDDLVAKSPEIIPFLRAGARLYLAACGLRATKARHPYVALRIEPVLPPPVSLDEPSTVLFGTPILWYRNGKEWVGARPT